MESIDVVRAQASSMSPNAGPPTPAPEHTSPPVVVTDLLDTMKREMLGSDVGGRSSRMAPDAGPSCCSRSRAIIQLLHFLASGFGSRKTILLVAVLGVFIIPLHADEGYQYMEPGSNGETIYHTVNINEQVKVVVINAFSGKQTANAVFDYRQNIIAYHMPYRGICIVAHMDIATFPELGFFERLIHTKREKEKELTKLLKNYEVTNQQVYDLSQFGGAVEGLCYGVPTYWAREYASPRKSFGANGCVGIHLFCLHVGLCAGFGLF
ncbi:gastrokine-2-like [Rhinophrynus dorsalis]